MTRAASDRLLLIAVTIRLVAYLFLVDMLTAFVRDDTRAALWYAIGMVLGLIISSMVAAVLCVQCDTCKRLNHPDSHPSVYTAVRRSDIVTGRGHVMNAIDTTPTLEAPPPEAIYLEQFSRLVVAGVEEYQLTEDVAEELAHDILLASLHQDQIDDPSTWYAAALKYAVVRRNRG